ncbi:hypothetical protein CEP52_005254 [Fusarium oligoseptatum]|uniref:Cdc24/Scd1 N-terminal domain-containing protein n=1 Tax=Fusarium oligoseptatum TaxID=2604345 RepID=A0A428TZI6_9HYPO|nr:hypothetical protein CEP52_005254 [Fusarium oligoseptatum]
MADPLSIAASIAGLLSTTGQIAKFLGPYVSAAKETPQITAHVYSEVQSTQVILAGLQDLTQNLGAIQARHAALIAVHQVVTILTDGVLLFSELEAVVRSLPPREGSDQRLPLRARLLWARKESTFTPLLTRVQSFKSSMTLILMILQSDSDRLAVQHQEQLSVNINTLLESNHALSRRLMNLEDALDVQTIVSKRMSLMSVSGTGPQSGTSVETQSTLTDTSTQPTSQGSDLDLSKFDFEDDLESSRVYRRAQRDTMDFSFRSSIAPSNIWSVFSGLSLGDISIISVIALPVYQEDITNAENYDFGAGVQVPATIPQAKKAERGLLHECIEIKLKMLQLPEINEYFDQVPSSDIEFFELWDVFSKGMPLLKLVQALDPQIDIVVDPRMRSPGGRGAAKDAIFQFLEYCRNDLQLSRDNLFTISDLVGTDAYGFSKVLAVVSFIIGKLTARGIVSAVDDQLKELMSSRVNSNPAEDQAHVLLEEFLADQCAFDLSKIQSLSSRTIPEWPDLKLARENLRQAMSIVNDRVGSEETSEAFTELKHRVEGWRGHNPTQFGTLLLYDSIIITKDKFRRPYRVYLFRNILLILKELELQRNQRGFAFWKSRRLPSDKQTKLRLKGRIYLKNILSVIVRPNPGSYICDVLWFADNKEEKECFSFEFAAEAQMNLWVSKLNEIRTKLNAVYGKRDANSHPLIDGVGPEISAEETDDGDQYYLLRSI